MKRIILVSFLLCLITSSMFSQSDAQLVIDAGAGEVGIINQGKLLIGTDTTLLGSPYQGNLLQIKSAQHESRIILSGANGGSNYNAFMMLDNVGNAWTMVHKSQVFNNHFLSFDYFDKINQTWSQGVLKLTSDGRVGLGYDWNEAPSSSKLNVKGGDINIEDIGNGIIMKSPDGQCWRVTVDNTGALVSTSIMCP